jgi:4-nitrophenyl phosphatase
LDGTLPGTGSLVKLLETSSGKRPLLIGKPSPLMFRLILREHGIAPSRALVIGDRIPIDIAGGRAAGAHTALVLTGIDGRPELARSRIKPDLVIRNLPDLLRLPGFPRPNR